MNIIEKGGSSTLKQLQLLNNKYKRIKDLGKGAFGEVF